jgi:hypothetical protein
MAAAKILQPNGLRPKYCQQTTYGLNAKAPADAEALFDLYL